jgi:HEPN domain-containing protein
MKKETAQWLSYACENLDVAKLLLESFFFNPCLQNLQQVIEKTLKAAMIERGIGLKKTHSVLELSHILAVDGLDSGISEDECDLIDSIYISSKYPLGSVLPDFEPDESICRECLLIAGRVYDSFLKTLDGK